MPRFSELVPLVRVQFSFSNQKLVPLHVREGGCNGWETPQNLSARKSIASGELILSPTEKCDVSGLLCELETSGYELVDVVHENRINYNDVTGHMTHQMVRYTFARREVATPSEWFLGVREQVHAELEEILRTAFWRVRAYLNPSYNKGEVVEGYSCGSVNFEARVPRFLPNGKPVAERKRDESGRKFGEPIPIIPNHTLHIDTDGTLSLV